MSGIILSRWFVPVSTVIGIILGGIAGYYWITPLIFWVFGL